MDREAALKKIKMFKTKAKAAKKAGKRDNALSFKYAMQRLQRELKASVVQVRRKKAETAEAVPGPVGEKQAETPAPAAG
jgi:hypothetical protein